MHSTYSGFASQRQALMIVGVSLARDKFADSRSQASAVGQIPSICTMVCKEHAGYAPTLEIRLIAM